MRLTSFRVQKFRNIIDSGTVDVEDDVTCLVGKNEAGKSALLEALYLLNPAYDEGFHPDEQYPRWLAVRDRKAGDLADTEPITASFVLDDEDVASVEAVLGTGVVKDRNLTVSRTYGDGYTWDTSWVDEEAAVRALVDRLPPTIGPRVGSAVTSEALGRAIAELTPSADGGDPTEKAIAAARTLLSEVGLDEDPVWRVAVDILGERLPRFFRFTDYSTLPGRVSFTDLAAGDGDGVGRTGLQTARALLRLAGTEVDQLRNEDYELRRGELEAVQIDLTRQVFEYWKQNPDLEVKIDVDLQTQKTPQGQSAVARFLEIRVHDRRTGYSNNFSQRSSGFQWFFSFLAAFSEFEDSNENVVVLLDEPALTLHGKAQADFLRFINERLAPAATVLYTTHSPFMVEADRLDRVRLVEDRGPDQGAVATAEVLGSDPDSLFPLQAALGYDIAQHLFVGTHNLVVEGTSDYLYLTLMSQRLGELGLTTLDDRWRLLPAGGATNIPTFVALIGPHLDVTVLADSDTRGMQRVTNMIAKGLLSEHRLVFAGDALPDNTSNADIEDLFTYGDYLKIFNAAFRADLKVRDLPPGDRITKRIERLHGENFDHGRPAEWLLRHHAELEFTDTTHQHWDSLMRLLNDSLASN